MTDQQLKDRIKHLEAREQQLELWLDRKNKRCEELEGEVEALKSLLCTKMSKGVTKDMEGEEW